MSQNETMGLHPADLSDLHVIVRRQPVRDRVYSACIFSKVRYRLARHGFGHRLRHIRIDREIKL